MKYDLHIHSKYSYDGILEPREIVRIAMRKGLNGVAITDHNTIKGGLETKEYETDDFKVIVGSEIMTERGEITGLFLKEEINSRNSYEVMEKIKEQDGIVVIPHPFDRLRKSAFVPTERDIKFIDCIEGYNSRCIFQRYNEDAIKFAMKYGLKIVAGSDAHYRNEIGNAGIETNEEDIRTAILGGVKLFGRRSSLINHAMTKTYKLTLRYIKRAVKTG